MKYIITILIILLFIFTNLFSCKKDKNKEDYATYTWDLKESKKDSKKMSLKEALRNIKIPKE